MNKKVFWYDQEGVIKKYVAYQKGNVMNSIQVTSKEEFKGNFDELLYPKISDDVKVEEL